jgi:Asp/Glu/hydantoin racemase
MGVVTSGMKVLELETLPKQQVLDTLGRIARQDLVQQRGAKVVVLGCAGMAGLQKEVEKACGEGVRVVDPVECGVELCMSLVRLSQRSKRET